MFQGDVLRNARLRQRLTQSDLAQHLEVSQGYVSLIERGERRCSDRLAKKLVAVLKLEPTALPVSSSVKPATPSTSARTLGRLGYPGFAHLGRVQMENPGETLLRVLVSDKPEARSVEGLAWLLLRYPNLDWKWMVNQAKVNDAQNRLGYVVTLARELADRKGDPLVANTLRHWEETLERSKLAREDAFGGSTLTDAERRWLRQHKSPEAAKWNMLASTTAEHLTNAY